MEKLIEDAMGRQVTREITAEDVIATNFMRKSTLPLYVADIQDVVAVTEIGAEEKLVGANLAHDIGKYAERKELEFIQDSEEIFWAIEGMNNYDDAMAKEWLNKPEVTYVAFGLEDIKNHALHAIATEHNAARVLTAGITLMGFEIIGDVNSETKVEKLEILSDGKTKIGEPEFETVGDNAIKNFMNTELIAKVRHETNGIFLAADLKVVAKHVVMDDGNLFCYDVHSSVSNIQLEENVA